MSTYVSAASPTLASSPPHWAGLDLPGASLNTPGSTEVSCLLMQDAVATNVLSAAKGSRPGSLAGKVALFSNPFLNGQEEAVVINAEGQLTYLRRAATPTGWEQSPITGVVHGQGSGGTPPVLTATEVVVVVHPKDLTVWALYQPATGEAQALQLVGPPTEKTIDWKAVPDSIRPTMAAGRASAGGIRATVGS